MPMDLGMKDISNLDGLYALHDCRITRNVG